MTSPLINLNCERLISFNAKVGGDFIEEKNFSFMQGENVKIEVEPRAYNYNDGLDLTGATATLVLKADGANDITADCSVSSGVISISFISDEYSYQLNYVGYLFLEKASKKVAVCKFCSYARTA